ncbi:MAG: hypothetical protein DRJ47_08430 [Thermoprotei archaeon]|nr:MAG: hypothetical protein DRJ47_08430 [Thermoprotei archaeon]
MSANIPRVVAGTFVSSLSVIFKLITRPVETIKQLGEEPDYLAPLLVLLLVIAAYTANLYVASMNVDYVVRGNMISAWKQEIEPVYSIMVASLVLYLILGWFTYLFLLFFVSRFLGSDKEAHSLFSLSGLIFHIYFIQLSLNAIALLFVVSSAGFLHIEGLFQGIMSISYGLAYKGWLEVEALSEVIKGLLEWFSYFWGAVYTYTVLREERELSVRGAIIGTAIIYPLNTLVSMFFAASL